MTAQNVQFLAHSLVIAKQVAGVSMARHDALIMEQPIGSAIDPDVDVIACMLFHFLFLGRYITVTIDYQPEEQVICNTSIAFKKSLSLTYSAFFYSIFMEKVNLLYYDKIFQKISKYVRQ